MMPPIRLMTYFAKMAHCCLLVRMGCTRVPSWTSADQPPACNGSSDYSTPGAGPVELCDQNPLPISPASEDTSEGLQNHLVALSRMPPSLGSPASLLRVLSVHSFSSLMRILSNIRPSIDHQRTHPGIGPELGLVQIIPMLSAKQFSQLSVPPHCHLPSPYSTGLSI